MLAIVASAAKDLLQESIGLQAFKTHLLTSWQCNQSMSVPEPCASSRGGCARVCVCGSEMAHTLKE